MSYEQIVHRMTVDGMTPESAETLVRTVVRELGRCIADELLRERIAAGLPAPLDADLMAGEGSPCSRHEFFSRIAASEKIPMGWAAEQCSIACLALALLLPGAAVQALRDTLPRELAELFAGREVHTEPPSHRDAHHSTLASGRPGSTHPLSESAANRAQTGSVSTPNPHEDRKLASGHERTNSLAEGRPGGTDPVADAKRT